MERFNQKDKRKKLARMRAEDDQDGPDLRELVQEIKAEGVAPAVSIHAGNKTAYVDAELIELDYGVSVREARKVKKLLERDPEVDVEAAAQRQRTP